MGPVAVAAIPAAIQGVSSVASGVMGGKGAKKAADTQLTATREALAFQREQKAAEEKRYADAMNLWLSGRRQLLDRYGLPSSALGPYESSPYTNAPARVQTPEGVPYALQRQQMLLNNQPNIPQAPQAGGLGELMTNPELTLNNWSDWERYGLRQV